MTSFKAMSVHSGEENFFRGFYHIWVWGPDWTCDPDHLNNFAFLKALEAVYEIWLQSAQWFQRRSHLKLWTNADGGQNLSILKAPLEPSAQVNPIMKLCKMDNSGAVSP